MADSNLYGTINDSDSDLSGTMYEYSGNQGLTSADAVNINYNNSASGLTAENVQDAIDEIAQNSGGGGASSYNDLSDKPSINGVTVEGNMTSDDLKLERGEDGGYYIPAVDAAGDLSWSASNDDMPGVETTNIKGNDGFSPTIETSEIENGHEVTFNDVNGSKIIKIMDGAALLYVVSEGETIEDARIAARAAGARFIFNPYASNSVEYVTAESFNTLFDARNGAVLLWSGTWTSGDITIAETNGSAGCSGSGNFSDFEKFFINVGNAFFECQIDSTGYLNGQGGYLTSGGVRYLRFVRFAVSGNTVTYTSHKDAYLTSSGATLGESSAAVTEIYGIPIR